MREFLLLLAVCALAFSSCTNDEENTAKSEAQTKYEQDMCLIRQMGYDVSEIQKISDGYIVEGDICLTHRHLDDFKSMPQTRHTFNWQGFEVSKERQTIRVRTHAGEYDNDVASAIGYWNQVSDCNIILETSGSGEIDINEEYNIDYDLSKLMVVTPPLSTGEPGSVRINLSCDYRPKKGSVQAMGMIVHAIGHAIGFGHTKRFAGEYLGEDDVFIAETEDYDPNSIMTKETNPLSWIGISKSDIIAFKTKYPKDEPEPEPEVDLSALSWHVNAGFDISLTQSNFQDNTAINFDECIEYTGSEWNDFKGKRKFVRILRPVNSEATRGESGEKFTLPAGNYTLQYGQLRYSKEEAIGVIAEKPRSECGPRSRQYGRAWRTRATWIWRIPT